ncbi:MAG: PAS domain-containing protein [Planctomycetes bacterium]|nr:PAS domain-containing protein [Planctomycetota bacterium]
MSTLSIAPAALLAHLPFVLALIGRDGRVELWSMGAERAFGVGTFRALGRDLRALGLAWDQERVDAAMQACRETNTTQKVEGLTLVVRSNRRIFGLTFHPLLLDDSGIAPILLLASDVTEREQVLQERLTRTRLETSARLARAVAHEINTPLQFLSDDLEFLAEAVQKLAAVVPEAASGSNGELGFLAAESTPVVAEMREGLSRIARIVRALGDCVQTSNDKRHPVDVQALVELAIAEVLAEKTDAPNFERLLEADRPEVQCSPEELQRALRELVLDAVSTHLAAGDRSAGARVSVRVWNEGENVLVAVSDGLECAPEAREGRLEPLVEGASPSERAGAGLAFVQTVAHGLGGGLRMDPVAAKHGAFVLRLPCSGAPSAAVGGGG